jgi:FtsH-binding integral membrane protein
MNNQILLIVIAFFVIYLISQGRNEPVTEKRFIVNTYLYILLGLIITSMTVVKINHSPELLEYVNRGAGYLGLMIAMFASLFIVLLTSPTQQAIKHIAWITFMISAGFMAFPVFNLLKEKGTLWNTILTLIAVLGGLSYLAYSRPIKDLVTWNTFLMISLFGLIVFELIDLVMLSFNVNSLNNIFEFKGRFRLYNYIAIMLFSGFVIYDTNILAIKGKYTESLYNDYGSQINKLIDYPSTSLSLYLDILNLFTASGNVQMN